MLSIDVLLTFWTLLVIVLLATAAFTADESIGRRRDASIRLTGHDEVRRHRRVAPPA